MNQPNALRLVRRWGWLLLLAAVAGGLVAYVASGRLPVSYQASTTLLVSQQQDATVLERADLETSAMLAATYAELLAVRPVLARAAADPALALDADEVAGAVEVSQQGQLITLTATHEEAVTASNIANVVAQTFIASPEAAATTGGLGAPAITVVEPAEPPTTPQGQGRVLTAMLGAALAFAGCLGLVALYEYLDRAVTHPQQVAALTGLPTLARLPLGGRTHRPADLLTLAREPESALAEEYRTARTMVRHALQPQPDESLARQVVVVSSAQEGEGKTSAVANLAVAFGLAGYRTLAVDADLRRPTLHQVFGLENREGLTTLLTATHPAPGWAAQGVAQATSHPGVSVITSGPPAPAASSVVRGGVEHANPADLLGSPELRHLALELREHFDVVLVDTPPALEAGDAVMVAEVGDAVVLVVEAGRTRADELCEAVERLSASGVPPAGVILNRTRPSHREHAYTTVPAPVLVSLPAAHREARRASVQAAAVEEPRSGA